MKQKLKQKWKQKQFFQKLKNWKKLQNWKNWKKCENTWCAEWARSVLVSWAKHWWIESLTEDTTQRHKNCTSRTTQQDHSHGKGLTVTFARHHGNMPAIVLELHMRVIAGGDWASPASWRTGVITLVQFWTAAIRQVEKKKAEKRLRKGSRKGREKVERILKKKKSWKKVEKMLKKKVGKSRKKVGKKKLKKNWKLKKKVEKKVEKESWRNFEKKGWKKKVGKKKRLEKKGWKKKGWKKRLEKK